MMYVTAGLGQAAYRMDRRVQGLRVLLFFGGGGVRRVNNCFGCRFKQGSTHTSFFAHHIWTGLALTWLECNTINLCARF
jgi:hypothetical protein